MRNEECPTDLHGGVIPAKSSHDRARGNLVGRGGMGVVYKAKDTKLDRAVALKVLPPHMLASEDEPFIAMEFIDGKSLADRIVEGPFPLHRDIKSANVMLTSDGTAKILDFGLAKTPSPTTHHQ